MDKGNGKVWCVVKPTVGIPAFLGGVMVVSMFIHHTVLANTTWLPTF